MKGILKLVSTVASAAATVSSKVDPRAAITVEVLKLFGKMALPTLLKPDVFGTAQYTPTGSFTSKETQTIALASPKKPV